MSPSSAPTSSIRARRAAEWLAKATGGKAKIIELEGTTGADPGHRPQEGLRRLPRRHLQGHADRRRPAAGMEIIASQTGDFVRDKGRQGDGDPAPGSPGRRPPSTPTTTRWRSARSPRSKAAGRKPGEDVISSRSTARMPPGRDRRRQARRLGRSSPFFGPIAFETMDEVRQRRGSARLGRMSRTASSTRATPRSSRVSSSRPIAFRPVPVR